MWVEFEMKGNHIGNMNIITMDLSEQNAPFHMINF